MAVTIDAKTVAKLREITGAGMMDCKKALNDTEGDFDKAIELLRTKGMATAEKKATRVAKDGCVALDISADSKTGIIFELNCETDFVAKNEHFQALLQDLKKQAIEKKFKSKEDFPAEQIKEFIAKLGENTSVGSFARYEANATGYIGCYMHPSPNPNVFKLGVMVEVEAANDPSANKAELATLTRDLAMQIASLMPQYVNSSEIPAEIIQKEKEIYMEQARQEGKKEDFLEKIATGKLNKFYTQVCLIDQAFIKDDKITVKQHVENISKQIGNEIKIVRFARIKVGEQA